MLLNVITVNEYNNSTNHYHEIHEIMGIQNINHAISIINDIIKDNIKYGCNDSKLTQMYIYYEGDSLDIEKYYRKHNKYKLYFEVHSMKKSGI